MSPTEQQLSAVNAKIDGKNQVTALTLKRLSDHNAELRQRGELSTTSYFGTQSMQSATMTQVAVYAYDDHGRMVVCPATIGIGADDN